MGIRNDVFGVELCGIFFKERDVDVFYEILNDVYFLFFIMVIDVKDG